MKKLITKTFKPLALLGLIALITVGCDRDYLNIESDISGVQNFSANRKVFPFVSYTKKPNPIQTNGLSNNLLGVYNDASQPYGTTEASIITQVLPTNLSPDFGVNPTLQSVKLYIPYYSEVESTDEDGIPTYKLDSVFGNQNESFKLSIYRSNYLLRDLDPATDFENQQLYYSNIFETIDINSQTLELLYEEDNFTISNSTHEITNEDEDEDSEFLAPGIYVDLNDEDNPNITNLSYWEDLFFTHQDSEELTNTSNFYNYFRGLIFKVEDNSGDGSMAMLNLSNSNATITLEYTYYDENDTNQEEELTGQYSLNFTGIKVNNFENIYTSPTDGDSSLGDESLYLKGMDGNFSVIKLFEGTIQDENGSNVPSLEYFKDQEGNWLINEANLTFYVNKPLANSDGTIDEPERLILFDIKNNTPIIDYFFDGSDNSTNPIFSKIFHSRPLELDENQVGERYKFRITEHVKNILLRDSTNVELGLYVSTNVNNISTSNISSTTDDEDINFVPSSSVISPKGTVLYGSKESIPEENRATFEIYYTEPEN